MIDTAPITSAQCPALPPLLHQHIPALARRLAGMFHDHQLSVESVQRLVVASSSIALRRALAQPQITSAAANPAANTAIPIRDERQGVFVSGGTINGTVVGVNHGTVNSYAITISAAGTVLNDGPPVMITVREQVLRLPRAARSFSDRTDALASLAPELQSGGGAWLHGPPGCGLTMLLRQAASTLPPHALPHGGIYLDGALEPDDLDEILRQLYIAYHESSAPIAVHPEVARSFLCERHALFVLDRLPLGQRELVSLSDTLCAGAVLIAAEGPAPDTLADLPVRGLPPQDAARLCASIAQYERSPADEATRLTQVCALLDGMPLALVLVGRLLRARLTTPAQLVTNLGELRARSLPQERAVGQPAAPTPDDMSLIAQEPLALAAQLVLRTVSDDARAVLAAVTHLPQVDLATLTSASQLPAAAVQPLLTRLIDLGLVVGGNDRYQIATGSLRRVLTQLLPANGERQRAAAFLGLMASTHAGDLTWLTIHQPNLLVATQTLLADGQAAEAGVLAQIMQPAAVLTGQWSTWGRVIDLAAQAARQTGDGALQAWVLHERGTRAGLLGDIPAAQANLEHARRVRLKASDHTGAAATLHNMRFFGLLPPASPPHVRQWGTIVGGIVLVCAVALGLLWFLLNPTAVADATSSTPGGAVIVDVLANDTTRIGTLDLASVRIATLPAHGSLTVDRASGTISYTPHADFSGADSFSYAVCNTFGRCSTATVTITVNPSATPLPIDPPPIANDDTAATQQNTAVAIDVLANDSDPEGALDPASMHIVQDATSGTVNADPQTGRVTYTPDRGFNGSDRFVYQVCDTQQQCATATVSVIVAAATITELPTVPPPPVVTVPPPNEPPVAQDDQEQTAQDESVEIDVLANDSDPEDALDPASVQPVEVPTSGTASADPQTGRVIYTPDRAFSGTDRFVYQVCDTQQSCATATVTVIVQPPPNEPPVAQDDQEQTVQDESVVINVLANDSDPEDALDPTSVTIVPDATNGTASADPQTGRVIYTPDKGFSGTDRFVYQVCDTQQQCATATVTVTVTDTEPPVVGDLIFSPFDLGSECRKAVPLDVQATARDASGVKGVMMRYQYSNSRAGGDWRTVPLRGSEQEGYHVTIDVVREVFKDLGNTSMNGIITYQLVATDAAGNSTATPLQTIDYPGAGLC